MKTSLKLSFAVFILVALSCSENKVQRQKPSDAKPILEISQQARGLRNVTGETVYFRLYNDKSFEYEYFDEKKKTKNFEKAEDINSLMKGILDEKEFQKIAGIINSGEFFNLTNKYERKCCCTDAFLDFKINVQVNGGKKTTGLTNYCDLSEIKSASPDLPRILSVLFYEIDNARLRYLYESYF